MLVTTDLTITGKVAQFGRGALADVSSKLIGQFVEQLETTVLNGSGGVHPRSGSEHIGADAAEAEPAPKPRAKKAADPKPVAAKQPVSPSPSSAEDAPGARTRPPRTATSTRR